MDIFDEIAEERRALADLLEGLTPQQLATQSLCREWRVHDVAAHLVVPLEVGIPRFVLTMVACGGRFDRANVRLAAQQARRPVEEIVGILRSKATHRFTPPGAGPEAPLTDLLVHGADIRRPLGIGREIPAERARTCLTFLTTRAAKGLVVDGAFDGLRFEAEDVGWSHGEGPVVRGRAEELLMALTGRDSALGDLHGDGVATLRSRVA